MSDDRPAIFAALSVDDAGEMILCVTLMEAEVIRDVLARVAGCGSRARVARRVFELLEGTIGYDCLDDDGLEGEIKAMGDL